MSAHGEADIPVITTYASLIGTFCHFLVVSIHTILYERNIYPRTAFLSARKYNFAVRQCRHPQVCQWITDAVAAIEEELLKGSVDKVAVIICETRNNTPLERFMFDVGRLPVVSRGEQETPFQQAPPTGAGKLSMPSPVDISEQFRAVMSRLSVCSSQLKAIPEHCSFSVCIELKENKEPPIGHPQPWIPAQPSLQSTRDDSELNSSGNEDPYMAPHRKRGDDLGGRRTTPLRSVAAGEMIFEMWIEEGKYKESLESSSQHSF